MENQQSYKDKNYKQALKDTFYGLDDKMRSSQGAAELNKTIGVEDQAYHGTAGCTATVIMVTQTHIICANAGDSRTVLSRGKVAVGLSEDHKPQNPQESERIEAAGGFVADNRVDGNLALSRALGDFEYKSNTQKKKEEQKVTAEPDFTETPITDDCEFVILACDGIWDVKSNQQAVDFVH